jgi:quinol monooxygenase YgiN
MAWARTASVIDSTSEELSESTRQLQRSTCRVRVTQRRWNNCQGDKGELSVYKTSTGAIAVAIGIAVLLVPVLEAVIASQPDGRMVRIAELEIVPEQLDAYKAILAEEQEASVRLEPGVLMLHSVALAEKPTSIRLLEVYASRSAYEAHVKAPHFIKYKTSTEKMVKSLSLLNTIPIRLCAKAFGQPNDPVSCL